MTKRIPAFLLSLVIIFAVLCTAAEPAFVSAYPALNDSPRHQLCTSLSDQAAAYYTGSYSYDVLSALAGDRSGSSLTATGSNLFRSLQTMMSSTQTASVSYSSLTTYWRYTDTQAGSSNPVLFYSDAESNSFNREHVWPKSHASYNQTNGGADLHHLRPTNDTINSTRGNYTFGNVKGVLSTYSTKTYDGKTVLWYNSSADLVEVSDDIKGDVARILLYVYVRWGQPNLFERVSSSQLPANDTGSSNDGLPVIESLETLLEWCQQDPVDQWEMTRNDRVQDVQGNRNVFIDYPELAWLLFGEDIPTSMQTPSGKAATSGTNYTVSAASDNTSRGTVSVSGTTVTAHPADGFAATGYTLVPEGAATVTQDGNYFTLTNITSDCTLTVKFTARSAATLSFAVPDGVSVSPINAYVGDTVTLPAVSGAVEGYEFVGYTDSSVAKTDTVPDFYSAGDQYTILRDSVLYALFLYRDESGEGTADRFEKLTSVSDDISGTYLIVYETGSKAFDSSLDKLDATENTFAVTIENGVINGAYADKAVTLEKVSGGYTIKTASGLYIGTDDGVTNTLKTSTDPKYVNTVTISSGELDIACTTGGHLRFNNTPGQDRFRYYKAATYTAQQAVALYRATSSSVRYYMTLADDVTPPVQPGKGDVNGDGIVNSLDYIMVKRAVIGLIQLNAAESAAADVDGDGSITPTDYILIKRISLGLI